MIVLQNLLVVIWILLICLNITTSFRRQKANERVKTTRKPFVVTKFLQDIWNYHNQIRWLHGVPPLELDKRLSENSEEWAEVMVRLGNSRSSGNNAALLKFVKWANDIYMENHYFDPHPPNEKIPSDPAYEAFFHEYDSTEVSAGKGWYSQLSHRATPMDYTCSATINIANVEQFAEVIWKSTQFVGCGHAFGFNPSFMQNVTVVVCQYLPSHAATIEDFCDNLMEPVNQRSLETFQPRNLTERELYESTKAKHTLVRFQKHILDFIRTMRKEKKKNWFDFMLFGKK